MVQGGEIVLTPEANRTIGAAVEVILEPFERTSPVDLHGHYYGALYQQV